MPPSEREAEEYTSCVLLVPAFSVTREQRDIKEAIQDFTLSGVPLLSWDLDYSNVNVRMQNEIQVKIHKNISEATIFIAFYAFFGVPCHVLQRQFMIWFTTVAIRDDVLSYFFYQELRQVYNLSLYLQTRLRPTKRPVILQEKMLLIHNSTDYNRNHTQTLGNFKNQIFSYLRVFQYVMGLILGIQEKKNVVTN